MGLSSISLTTKGTWIHLTGGSPSLSSALWRRYPLILWTQPLSACMSLESWRAFPSGVRNFSDSEHCSQCSHRVQVQWRRSTCKPIFSVGVMSFTTSFVQDVPPAVVETSKERGEKFPRLHSVNL